MKLGLGNRIVKPAVIPGVAKPGAITKPDIDYVAPRLERERDNQWYTQTVGAESE